MYERIKAVVWPHAVVPLGIMVLLDYVTLISAFMKVAAAAYLFLYTLGFAVGVWAGLMAKAEQGIWKEFLRLKVAATVPSILVGAKFAVSMASPVDGIETVPSTEHVTDE